MTLARLVLVASSLLFLAGCDFARSGGGALVGAPLPAFDLPALDGGRVSSGALAGEPLVVNFWATWCNPCVREIPTLNQLHRDGAARVVAISLDDADIEVVRAFVESEGIEYPVLLGDFDTFQSFGGSAIPFTVVADAELVVRDAHRGLVSRRTLERSLAKAAPAVTRDRRDP